MRARFLFVAVLGFSVLIAITDLLIRILYDARYQAAGWMLSVMLIGRWFSALSYINEATLVGFGHPLHGAYSFELKFAALLIGLPLAFMNYGIVGAVSFVVVSDIFRYGPLLIGQTRERFSSRLDGHSLVTRHFLALADHLWSAFFENQLPSVCAH